MIDRFDLPSFIGPLTDKRTALLVNSNLAVCVKRGLFLPCAIDDAQTGRKKEEDTLVCCCCRRPFPACTTHFLSLAYRSPLPSDPRYNENGRYDGKTEKTVQGNATHGTGGSCQFRVFWVSTWRPAFGIRKGLQPGRSCTVFAEPGTTK